MTRRPSDTRTEAIDTGKPNSSFPKQNRILRRSEYATVYQAGFRVPGPHFVAFCFARDQATGPRFGFTVPRAIGKAVVRNRIKRRLREVVRRRLGLWGSEWDVVFNARRTASEAAPAELEREVERVIRRCKAA